MILKLMTLVMVSVILSIGIIPALSLAESIKAPRQQMNDGIKAQDVICKGGYTLMIRMGGDAACVTPSTASKLNTAGWGEIIKEFEEQSEPQDEGVSLNEGVSMSDDEGSEDDEESENGQTVEVNINDGIGSSDHP